MSDTRSRGATVLLLLLACGGGAGERARSGSDSAAPPAATKESTGTVELQAMSMLPQVRAHLDSVAADPAMLHAAMPEHQAEMRRLVNAVHADMARLGMHSDPAYEALADSIVNASDRLATARGKELERLTAQHIDQVRRLANVYEAKTAGSR
jgi:hypothetical protein